jgi:hypothetical protein
MTSGIRRLAFAFVTALLAISGATLAAAPAHAEPDVIEATLTMTADPDVPTSAVLHAELTGAFVDAGGVIPGGTWSFLVADDSGATLFAAEVARPSDGPTFVDVVWSEVPSGILASGVVSYTPNEAVKLVEFAGATASFETEGTPEQAGGAALSREVPTATGSAKVERAPDPFTIGLGVLAAASLLVAGTGIALLVRRDRRAAGGRM